MPTRLERRQSFHTVAWFRDLYRRQLLDLDPPYQRRSVWNQDYRDFFVETVLLQYPAPAIFVHEVISPDGVARYSVVDGKQRLTTLFDFTEDLFPIGDKSLLTSFQGLFFSQLEDDVKKAFWTYQFSVEFLPTVNESTLTNVFDRINRNVAKLTRQELRHARFGGSFASAVERLNDYLLKELPGEVPRIAQSSRHQMKDIEFVAQLLLLLENGPQSFSQDELDDAYSERDSDWETEVRADSYFRTVVAYLKALFAQPDMTASSLRRLKNQADFYSLFGAVFSLQVQDKIPDANLAAQRLKIFFDALAEEGGRERTDEVGRYYQAARSASNDLRQRVTRINTLTAVLSGESPA